MRLKNFLPSRFTSGFGSENNSAFKLESSKEHESRHVIHYPAMPLSV